MRSSCQTGASVKVDVIDRYDIVGSLGTGGMAHVFKASDRSLNRTVAIKIMRAQFTSEADLARSEREGKILAKLSHPNVVRVYHYGLDDEQRPFIVMEYVEGCSLRSWLDSNGRMDCRQAMQLCFAICDALAYVHDHGVVHRDLNPNNILLVGGDLGRPKIVDFGLSKVQEVSQTGRITKTGELVGTPHYLSPEQCRGEDVDQRCDLYSLGCTLYECIAGEKLFDADTAVALMLKHQNDEPARLSNDASLGELGRQLDVILENALSKDKADRYQSALDFACDLRAVLAGKGGYLARHSGLHGSRALARSKSTRGVAVAIALVFAFFLISEFGVSSTAIRAMQLLPVERKAAALVGFAQICEQSNYPRVAVESYSALLADPCKHPDDVTALVLAQYPKYVELLLRQHNASAARGAVADYFLYLANVFTEVDSKSITTSKVHRSVNNDTVLADQVQKVAGLMPYAMPPETAVGKPLMRLISATNYSFPKTHLVLGRIAVMVGQSSLQSRSAALWLASYGKSMEPSDPVLAHALLNQALTAAGAESDGDSSRNELITSDLFRADFASELDLHAFSNGGQIRDFNDDEERAAFLSRYATVLWQIGKYDQAITVANELVRSSTVGNVHPGIMGILASASLCSGQIELARMYLPAAAAEPWRARQVAAVLNLVEGRRQQGTNEIGQWQKDANASLNVDKNNSFSDEFARLLIAVHQYEIAERFCREQLDFVRSKNFKNSVLHFRIAQCLVGEGRLAEALRTCEDSLNTVGRSESVNLAQYLMMVKLLRHGSEVGDVRKYAVLALPLCILRYGERSRDAEELRHLIEIPAGNTAHSPRKSRRQEV
jgi:predicted Ser/Thr protein kinase